MKKLKLPGASGSTSPKTSEDEVETIEQAIKNTRARLSLQQEWLQQLKSAESELSRPEPDYGW